MNEINVLSSDLDGAELHNKKARYPRYNRCDGKDDNEEIQEAINSVGITSMFISANDWKRIFRGRT